MKPFTPARSTLTPGRSATLDNARRARHRDAANPKDACKTGPQPPRPTPDAPTPLQAPLDYARPSLARPGPPLWRQMLEAFGFLAVATIFTGVVVAVLDAADAGAMSGRAGVMVAGIVALAGVLTATRRRRAWRGMLFVLLLLAGVTLLLIGLCFAVFTIALG